MIISVSSGAANRVIRTACAYCASKAALTHFKRVLAAEEPRITSISIRPGVVDTDMQAVLRELGPLHMPADEARFYQIAAVATEYFQSRSQNPDS